MFTPTDEECTELVQAYYRAVAEVSEVAEKEFKDSVQAAVATLIGFQSILVVRITLFFASSQEDAVERIRGLTRDVKRLVGGIAEVNR